MNKNIKKILAVALVSASFSTMAVMPAFAASQYVQVTGNPVAVREDAGTSGTFIKHVHKGDKFTYVAEKNDANGVRWYQIQLSKDKKGWITSKFSKTVSEDNTSDKKTTTSDSSTQKQVQITGNPVMVRADAGTKYKKIGSTSSGKKYTYLASKKDSTGRVWYQIQFTSKTKGWVTSQFAKLVGETAAVNPVTAYEGTYQGTYQCDRASITVKASGKSDAKITVEWGSSAWEMTTWEMSGMFDPSVYRVDYGNGIKTNYVYDDNGNVSSKEVEYKDSTGRIQFKDTKTLVWRDENEQERGEMTFTKISSTTPADEKPAAAVKQVQITGNPVMVRADAGTTYKKIGRTSSGKKYTYLASKKDSSGRVWYQIQFTSATKGWVTSQFSKLVG